MQSFHLAEPYDIMTHRLFPYNDLAAYLSARLVHYRDSVQTILDVANSAPEYIDNSLSTVQIPMSKQLSIVCPNWGAN